MLPPNATAATYRVSASFEKQKVGKKRVKQIGSVEVPQKAFLAVSNWTDSGYHIRTNEQSLFKSFQQPKILRSLWLTCFHIQKIFKDYANGGNVLMLATVLALLVVNLPFSTEFYNSLWTREMALRIGDFNLFSHHGEPMSVMAFINDALMAVFFFSVESGNQAGSACRRASFSTQGPAPHHRRVRQRDRSGNRLLSPCQRDRLCERMCNPYGHRHSLLARRAGHAGNRVPIGLKVFLTTLAVVDDIGGILVIAIFYSSHINYWMLLAAAGILVVLALGELCSRYRARCSILCSVPWCGSCSSTPESILP